MTENTHVDDPQVAAILAAAAAPAEAPLPGESEALTAFRSVHHPHRRLHLMSRKSENAKLVAAAVFGGLVVLSGAAAAATGALPLGHTNNGHNHPTPVVSHTPDATDQGDNDSQDTPDTTSGSVSTLDQNQGKGSEISTLAHSVTGHKGKTICIVAAASHCHAAQSSAAPHGQSALPHGKSHQNGQSTVTTHGHSTTTHGQSTTTHGQSTTTHGQSTTTHGQSGQTHGQSQTH